MAHVMSSQLPWPTTAKTESPRKEPTNSLRLLFNDVTTQRATLSSNDPRAIWEISNYDSLLIDLKISSHIRWPFGARVGRAPTPSLEWSELCLDSLTRLVILVPVTSDQAVNTRSGPWGAPTLRTVGSVGNLNGLYFSHTDGLSKLKLVVLLMSNKGVS